MEWAIIGACVGFMWGVFLCDLLNKKEKEIREKKEAGRKSNENDK